MGAYMSPESPVFMSSKLLLTVNGHRLDIDFFTVTPMFIE